ncbi:cuticle protein 10.9-like [Tropilaelaps mercedesae]|uniref:Cuticle protein 10.9-like n=1 Tax=Tropilaelaps mercedesae TaxID=418985 RepID=A0A1V9Y3L7_9ACAR|nr:cuticle protein 10.9-like [Tropilaelaps mercedesae]
MSTTLKDIAKELSEESTDESGRVTGRYTLTLTDGRQKTVNYWADDRDFHANIITNGSGTKVKEPG